MKEKKTKKAKGPLSKVLNFLILLFFLAGAGVFTYPTFSDMWNQYRNEQLVSSYQSTVQDLEDTDKEKLWQSAQDYNAQHDTNRIVDAFNEDDDYVLSHPYDSILDVNGDGLMGSIEIPKLKLDLAIYHGIGNDVLEKGIGHVEGTSIPIGGKGTHAVLAGHRGLPSAKLFTDLDQMEMGDIFLIHVLDQTLAYKVDQIKTVLPENTEDLAIDPEEDYVTLITCTPYGVNTHRLLVRGVRTSYQETKTEKTVAQELAKVSPMKIMLAGLVVLVLLLGVIYFLVAKRRASKSKKSPNSKP